MYRRTLLPFDPDPLRLRPGLCSIAADDPGGDGGGGGGGDPAPGGGAPAAGDPPAAAEWTSGLDDDDRTLAETKGWKAPGDALRDYRELESLIGKNRVAPPPEDATPEQVVETMRKLGAPESYEDHEFAKPEGVEEWGETDLAFQGSFKAAAAEVGLLPQQVAGLEKWWNGFQGEIAEAQKTMVANAETTLKKEWGGEFDAKADLANRAYKLAAGDQLDDMNKLRLADGTFLGDNPLLMRAFARLGAMVAEEGELPGGGEARAGTAEAKKAYDDFNAANQAILTDRGHPEHKAKIEERARLARAAFPDDPARPAVRTVG